MVIILVPLSNQELYRIINKENQSIEMFRKANPQFQIDTSNLAHTIEEIEYFEHLYSHMGIGEFEFAPDQFNFKRVDSYTFQQIFSDNFNNFLIDNPSLKIRPVVIDEINKMISCQDPSMGHAIYECPDCHKTYCVPFTCKSRFCNTCAIKYQMDRALEISSKLIKCEHRHIVFTIPEQLRIYFRKDRNLLNLLFRAAEDCIKFFFKKRAPRKKLTPGIVLVLHTFGKDLKWNPHIHCLVTEGASSNINNCPFDGNPDGAIKYLLRYFNRPAMAKSRILYYDGTYVVFYYQRHEDNMYVIEKVHVYDLIKCLIIHIPDKNFKMLRYAGLYSSHKCVHFDKLIKKLSDVSIKTKKMLANWRMRIQMCFHYDPLVCPFCHSTMTFSELVIAKNSS